MTDPTRADIPGAIAGDGDPTALVIAIPLGDGELTGHDTGPSPVAQSGASGERSEPDKPRRYKPWLRLVSMSDLIPRDPGPVNPGPKTVKRRAGGFRRVGGRR